MPCPNMHHATLTFSAPLLALSPTLTRDLLSFILSFKVTTSLFLLAPPASSCQTVFANTENLCLPTAKLALFVLALMLTGVETSTLVEGATVLMLKAIFAGVKE